MTVYNPVRRQNDYMRERFRRHGLGDKIRLVEGDHRDIVRESGRFDRFVSIGVHEHAGHSLKQYRLWAEAIETALKDGGLGVVSTTSWMSRKMTGLLTLKYIFPGGHVPSLPDTLAAFERAGLMLIDVESLWPHYQRTMDEWRKNFAKGWPEIFRNWTRVSSRKRSGVDGPCISRAPARHSATRSISPISSSPRDAAPAISRPGAARPA